MTATVIVGAHWGDEGKGRITDYMATKSDMVARYAGGDNAGHTVIVGDQIFQLHLIPTGILHEHVTTILGHGMVINPVVFAQEIQVIQAKGIDVSPARVRVGGRAHLITPTHIAWDNLFESQQGNPKLGTTKRGIGPAYADKMRRRGLRVGDILSSETFADKFHQFIKEANAQLELYGEMPIDQETVDTYEVAIDVIRPYIQEITVYLNDRLKAGHSLLCEGAQGTLLDIDHGTYPFVTSSSCSVGGVLTSLGIGANQITNVIGVVKAFSTRVGEGPMPTELHDKVASYLRGKGDNAWDEYGTTTGRPRRCGWLDGVALRYAALINGFSQIVVTKLDSLTGLDTIKLAVAYEKEGYQYTNPPSTVHEFTQMTPVYEVFSGWDDDVSQARVFSDLPLPARTYLNRISELCETPIQAVSVGPERDQIVWL